MRILNVLIVLLNCVLFINTINAQEILTNKKNAVGFDIGISSSVLNKLPNNLDGFYILPSSQIKPVVSAYYQHEGKKDLLYNISVNYYTKGGIIGLGKNAPDIFIENSYLSIPLQLQSNIISQNNPVKFLVGGGFGVSFLTNHKYNYFGNISPENALVLEKSGSNISYFYLGTVSAQYNVSERNHLKLNLEYVNDFYTGTYAFTNCNVSLSYGIRF